jgi:endogenous inhibitor of DNA gyrase (YacG/DUF329 family)
LKPAGLKAAATKPFVLVFIRAAMKRACPICRKASDSETNADFPFCGERCRLIDLGNWSSEKYVISNPTFDEAEEESPRTGDREDGEDSRQ